MRAARHFAGEVALRWGFAGDEVELVISELAANAVQHSNSTFSVTLSRKALGLLVEVADDDPRRPEIADGAANASSGRGLLIIDRLARSWGVRGRLTDTGKVIWVELDDKRGMPLSYPDCA